MAGCLAFLGVALAGGMGMKLTLHQLEPGIYEIPLVLTPGLEPQREALRSHVVAAQRRVRAFAARHGWTNHTGNSFADEARIFERKADYDRTILAMAGADPATQLPKTYSAALENRVLLSVSPALYRANFPDGDEPHAFEKLLAHEMAHRLHVRVLAGNEEAMGPIWFFEGFAIYASDQFAGDTLVLAPAEIWAVVTSDTRGSYRKYGAVFRHFTSRAPLSELVARAGRPGFVDWLKQIDGTVQTE